MKVKFLPLNVEHEINPNESVLELAKRQGIFIKSICGGVPSCSECRVKVVAGEHNIMPPSFKEKNLIGSAYFIDRSRLSCQLKCLGDVTVDVTEQVEKQHAQPASKKPRMPMRRNPNQPRPASMPRQQFKPPSTEKKDSGSGSGSGEDQS
jgi:ferredoxin, 2Fe-2S